MKNAAVFMVRAITDLFLIVIATLVLRVFIYSSIFTPLTSFSIAYIFDYFVFQKRRFVPKSIVFFSVLGMVVYVILPLCQNYALENWPYAYRGYRAAMLARDIELGHNLQPEVPAETAKIIEDKIQTKLDDLNARLKTANESESEMILAQIGELSKERARAYELAKNGKPKPKTPKPVSAPPKPQVKVEYRDRVVEKVIEVPVEKIVEVPAAIEKPAQQAPPQIEKPAVQDYHPTMNTDPEPDEPQHATHYSNKPSWYLGVRGKTVCYGWEPCYGPRCARPPCYIPPPQKKLNLNPQHLLHDAINGDSERH